jgi:hypothetical protein
MAGEQIDLHVAAWLIARLEGAIGPGDIQARISGAYRDVIPAGKTLPAVRFHVQSSRDVRGAARASARIMTQIDWLIVVVNKGTAIAPIVPIADALDQRLHDSNGETSAIEVYQCIRLEPFGLLDVEDSGDHYRHAGGLYRTIARPK